MLDYVGSIAKGGIVVEGVYRSLAKGGAPDEASRDSRWWWDAAKVKQ